MEAQSSGHGGRARPIRVAVLTAALVVAMVAATIGAFTFGGYLGAHTSAAPLATNAQPLSAAAQSTATTSSVAGLSVADVAAKANPAVVTISNLQTVTGRNGGFFGLPGGNGNNNGQPQLAGKGSGFIIDSKGDVITNAHVVAGATQLQVEFYNGKTANATLVGADPIQDIAVIRLDLSGGVKLPGIATLGNSSTVRPGDPVVAIGSALGTFNNTVTDGIVGGVNRVLDEGNGNTPPLINLIQHDAPLSSGNSGGPLLNLQGQVIGVNVAAIPNGNVGAGNQANGLDFAISINAAKKVADQLIATGHVSYPFLGITSEDTSQGAQVDSVQSGTPADKAGLQQGDVITALDGQQITDQTPLVALLYQHKPGDKVTLTVDRNGQTQTVSVTLGTLPTPSQ